MHPTQKDYFNTDINISWFAQAECLPCCDWNWELQSTSHSPNPSTMACFCQTEIIVVNPFCDCSVKYCYVRCEGRGGGLLCVTWIQSDIHSVRITLPINITPYFPLLYMAWTSETVYIRYMLLRYWYPVIELGAMIQGSQGRVRERENVSFLPRAENTKANCTL